MLSSKRQRFTFATALLVAFVLGVIFSPLIWTRAAGETSINEDSLLLTDGSNPMQGNLNMSEYQVIDGVFHKGSEPPGDPEVGQWFYDTDDYTLYVYNGTAWDASGEAGAQGPAGTVNGLPFSYLVFTNSTSIYMVNGTTGEIDGNNSDAKSVIESAISPNSTIYLKEGVYEVGNNTQFEDCDSAWSSAQGANVVVTTDTSDKKEGTGSSKLDVQAGASTGLLAYHDFSSVNLGESIRIGFWFNTSIDLDDGDLQLLLDDSSGCGSPVETMDINWDVYEYIKNGTWLYTHLHITNTGTVEATHYPTNLDSIVSVGVSMAVDKGAFTFWIDDISGLDAGITTFNEDNVSFVFAEGAIIKLEDESNYKTFHFYSCDHVSFLGSPTIDGNRHNQDGGTGDNPDEWVLPEQGHGIGFYQSDFAVVENTKIYRTNGHALMLRECDDSKVEVTSEDLSHCSVCVWNGQSNRVWVDHRGIFWDGCVSLRASSGYYTRNNYVEAIVKDGQSNALRLDGDSGSMVCNNICHVVSENTSGITVDYAIDNEVHLVDYDGSSSSAQVYLYSGAIGNQFYITMLDNDNYGIWCGGSNNTFNLNLQNSGGQAVYVSGSYNHFTGHIYDCGSHPLRFVSTGDYNTVSQLTVLGGNYGIAEDSGADYNLYVGCRVNTGDSNDIAIDGANSYVMACWNGTSFVESGP